MNRKAKSKAETKAKKVTKEHPFDDIREWVGADFSTPPLDAKWQAEFQKKIDSAFGAENALILAWSGDSTYWDGFYTDWYADGSPKEGSFEKKPILLLGKYKLNKVDYYYVIPPRWVLLEREDRSQYEADWESSSWVADPKMLGGRKRIRRADAPPSMYRWLRTIAQHDGTLLSNDMPRCCQHMVMNLNRPCHGKYRPPADVDLAFIRKIRENMDAAGVAQRADAPRSAKILQDAASTTKFYLEEAAKAERTAMKEFMMADPQRWVGDLIHKTGNTLSAREIEAAMIEGLKQTENEPLGA